MTEATMTEPTKINLFKQAGHGVAAFFKVTHEASACSYLTLLKKFADHYENKQLKATHPEIFNHLKIQEESVKLTKKMARFGPAHRKAIKSLAKAKMLILHLEESRPATLDNGDEVNFDLIHQDLKFQIDRLERDLTPCFTKSSNQPPG